MPLRNSDAAFGSVARLFHWGMALLLIVSLAIIEAADFAPRGSALKTSLRDWHAQIGFVVLAVVWFRLFWRLTNVIPAIVPPIASWQRITAHVVEWTFYVLMILQPVLGILMLQADGKQAALLGMALPTFVGVDKAWSHRIEDVHAWLGNAMMVLIAIHVAAALWHGFVRRDNTLARMAGGNRATRE